MLHVYHWLFDGVPVEECVSKCIHIHKYKEKVKNL